MSNLSALAGNEMKHGITFKNGSPPLIRLSITTLRVMFIMRALWPGVFKAAPSIVGQNLALCCGFMENV
jgi:predicted anti-sigma-YlaC factor YlaD